jgi:ankyrin repeat protein
MGESEFMEAVKAGESDRVRSLIQADPGLAQARDRKGVSAVLRAVYQGHGDLAEELAGQAGDLDLFEAAAEQPGPELQVRHEAPYLP